MRRRIDQPKLKSAMTYPIVVSIVAILVVMFLDLRHAYLVGMFDSMEELPFVTRLLMGISSAP